MSDSHTAQGPASSEPLLSSPQAMAKKQSIVPNKIKAYFTFFIFLTFFPLDCLFFQYVGILDRAKHRVQKSAAFHPATVFYCYSHHFFICEIPESLFFNRCQVSFITRATLARQWSPTSTHIINNFNI
jgi:hypothetical protein